MNPETPRPKVTTIVLVVDDEPGVHAQFRMLMETPPPANVEILSARSAEEAYEVIRQRKPEVLLLDLNLTPALSTAPDRWNPERTMREIQPLSDAADAPVIAFSGMAPDELWPAAVRKHGAYNFFSKQEMFAPGEFIKPTFRAQLLKDITNAMFLHRFHRERYRHAS